MAWDHSIGGPGRPGLSLAERVQAAVMGGSGNRLSKELLVEYQDLTFLTKQEILLAHKRFCELLPLDHRSMEESLQARVSFQQIFSLPELKADPFKERICRVSSSSPARDKLSVEDFLELLSVFSDTATPDIKSHSAFRIFDFDDDGTLNRGDLSQLVNSLTGESEGTQLSASMMKQLIDNILEILTSIGTRPSISPSSSTSSPVHQTLSAPLRLSCDKSSSVWFQQPIQEPLQ